MKRSKIKQIISEEISRARKLEERAIIQDELGSISPIEIEEMLNNYFKRHEMPENINRLSVLFDVLDKAGLKNLTDSYQRVIEESPDMAMEVLDHVKTALKNIRRKKGKISVAVQDAGNKALDKMGYLDDKELEKNYGSSDRAGIVRGEHPLKEEDLEEIGGSKNVTIPPSLQAKKVLLAVRNLQKELERNRDLPHKLWWNKLVFELSEAEGDLEFWVEKLAGFPMKGK